jgi:hypothetical protein
MAAMTGYRMAVLYGLWVDATGQVNYLFLYEFPFNFIH